MDCGKASSQDRAFIGWEVEEKDPATSAGNGRAMKLDIIIYNRPLCKALIINVKCSRNEIDKVSIANIRTRKGMRLNYIFLFIRNVNGRGYGNVSP